MSRLPQSNQIVSKSDKFDQFLPFQALKVSYRWSVTVSRVKIRLVSCLETEQVVAKDLLTAFDDLQSKRRCVEEGDACME
jgi:hypothetical protein